MKRKTYFVTVTILFAVVTTTHLLRIIFDWPLQVGDLNIPMWVSWVGVIFIGLLAYHGFRLRRRNGASSG